QRPAIRHRPEEHAVGITLEPAASHRNIVSNDPLLRMETLTAEGLEPFFIKRASLSIAPDLDIGRVKTLERVLLRASLHRRIDDEGERHAVPCARSRGVITPDRGSSRTWPPSRAIETTPTTRAGAQSLVSYGLAGA